jgi:hypothetical protein
VKIEKENPKTAQTTFLQTAKTKKSSKLNKIMVATEALI